jgi:cytochrome c oxidase subunit IV
MGHSTENLTAEELKAQNIKRIWQVAGLLAVVTGIEFLIAFTMPANILRVSIFIGLTIVKAFYIVADFMHLRHEVKTLIWSILIPLIFIVWLIIALLMEGSFIYGYSH